MSPTGFSVSFCCGYLLLYSLNKPLFWYYPAVHQWAWRAAAGNWHQGPPIVWYGLVIGATLVAATFRLEKLVDHR
jgi:hypothetical protein